MNGVLPVIFTHASQYNLTWNTQDLLMSLLTAEVTFTWLHDVIYTYINGAFSNYPSSAPQITAFIIGRCFLHCLCINPPSVP
jgi:hypothetical protein